MSENTVINELNTLLKGEQMAIEAYEKFIQFVENDVIKGEFQEIQKEHKKYASDIAGRIQTLGGHPEYGTGLIGFMSGTKIAMQSTNKDTIDILKKAYDGEDKGIAMAEEIVKGDLDQESAEMVDGILSKDHDHLKRMMNLISNFENKH